MADDSTEMVISYETIFELLRREKSRDEIQKLPSNFRVNLASYVARKKSELKTKESQSGALASAELRKAQAQLDSLIRVVTELYDKREKKILNMALTKSRTNADIVDVANLTSMEQEAFFSIVDKLNHYRSEMLGEFLSGHAAQVPTGVVPKPRVPQPVVEKKEEKTVEEPKKEENKLSGKKMVKFNADVPKFFDREMNVLGPFKEGEIASLPTDIADILIKKGRVQIIED